MIKEPSFIEREGQSLMDIIMHEFQVCVFNHFIKWEDFTMAKQGIGMISIAR
jgi:hypothetical protein